MRIGFNPNKDQKAPQSDYFHQVVIPVYIPNFEGYFKDSLIILKYCVESLLKTCHSKTYFTIVNNGSCVEVIEYLVELKRNKQIQELIHTTNIGKLNSVLKGLIGHSFQLVTISDADVLFLNNWQKETYRVFEEFPKTGVVCPTPSAKSYKTYTSNIYWDYFFSRKLTFTKVKNPEALVAFAKSIGNEYFYNKEQLKQYLTVSKNDFKAVVGAGHFAGTYRGEIFDNNLIRDSKFQLGGTSEGIILDIPVVKKGFWRLSTDENYAYHMGNVLEDWMLLEFNKLENKIDESFELSISVIKSSTKWSYWIKTKVFSKLIFNKKMFKYFLIWKGLSKKEVKKYLK
jgi:Glycosyl transferase family 2